MGRSQTCGAREAGRDALGIGYGPFSRATATRIAEDVGAMLPDHSVRLEEDVTPNSLRRVGAHELDGALVMETPMRGCDATVYASTRCKDEPLLAALPASHRFVGEGAMPVGEFAAERVLLPREPPGQLFNSWLRTLIRAHGFELERTMATLSAPWDRRMLPIASGEAVCRVRFRMGTRADSGSCGGAVRSAAQLPG